MTSLVKQKKSELNQDNIEKAKIAIHERMKITSQKVLEEIPHCPLSEERIIVQAGNPVDEIVNIAKDQNFDLIIMGTHGPRNSI